MLTRLIPMFFAAVAMAPLVVMVTGQSPTEQELQQAVTQAKTEMEAEAAAHLVSGGAEPEESPLSGALHALAREHRSTPMARELSKCATVLEKVAKHFISSSRRRSYTLAVLSAIDSPSVTSVCDATSMEPVTCPSPAVPEFRSANGRCNNRNHPLWGSSEQPFKRLLEPQYGDGLATPRSNGRDGAPLPSARLVSTVMHEDLRKSSPVNTHMVMQFGQFLDHDITLTPNFAEEGLVCTCDSEDEHCFNIDIPDDDPDIRQNCLPFARSLSCPNEGCHLGRRQQLNQLTAFVDASNVYGSSDREIEELREHAESPVVQVTCPAGYQSFQQNCFKAFPQTKPDYTWAAKACMAEGGVLAMPKDAATNAFLVQLKNAVQNDVSFYIGLSDQNAEGQWRFADGTALGSYNNWQPGEPNNSGNEDCAILLPGGKWNDVFCSIARRYICQVPPSRHGCHFPFTYKGQTYTSCTNVDHDRPWCSLTAVYNGAWKNCEASTSQSQSAGVNLALRKPTAQSSTSFGGVAERAVDGNTGGNWFVSHSCTATSHQSSPWWRVDLGRSQAIGSVVVFNRQDCCPERLNSFRVHVGDSPTVTSNPQCGGNHAVTSGRQTITVDCDGRRGRYVGISLPTTQILTLCEVQVYGVSPLGGERGLLKSRPNAEDANKKELLPAATEEVFECPGFSGAEACSQAGDVRVNEQPGLTSMHTVFLREHNRIARRLSQLNPRWDDDRVFFETRKIVGALMQKITYGEDLPHVLGRDAMTKFHLTLLQSGFFSGYDPSVNPTISNVFATAAYRFGHSLVNNIFLRHAPDFSETSACPIRLGFGFFNPTHILNNDQGGPGSILRGLTAQPQQDFDRFMVSALTKQLFADPPGSLGLDLAALNIQRGRDHGLPGYNAWRVKCGLPRANSFDELAFEIPDCFTRKRLENLYRHVDDIDVFAGGLAEESVPDGVVGPTFACLIGLQFQALRKGDRFWFENPGQFTAAQLAEIRKTSLARILCDNTDGTTDMQPDVFSLPTQSGNERVACSSLPQMDLTKWQEPVAISRGLPESLEGQNAAMSGREFEDHDAEEEIELVAEEARDLLELLRGEQDDIYREENAGPGGELVTNDIGYIEPEDYGQDMANNLE